MEQFISHFVDPILMVNVGKTFESNDLGSFLIARERGLRRNWPARQEERRPNAPKLEGIGGGGA